MMPRILLSFLLLLLLSACGDDDASEKAGLPVGDTSANSNSNTITIGKFRFSGSAESGQYASHLFKLDRLIRDEMGRAEGWQVIESDRSEEVANQLLRAKGSPETGLSGAPKLIPGEEAAERLMRANAPPETGLSNVRYLLVGEMDGFDLVMADAPAWRDDGGRKTAATVTGRRRVAHSRISLRVVDVMNKRWLVNKVIEFEEPVQDRASAETQINHVLSRMASIMVGETLLAAAGMPTVAAVNADGTLILNRGNIHGVRVGHQWSLERTGASVKDPETGKVLSGAGRIIGDVEVVRVADDHAIASFQGRESAQVGDKAIPVSVTGDSQDLRIQPVRVAVGGFILDPTAQRSLPDGALIAELEASLLHRLQRDSGMKVIEQDSAHLKKLLAQQMLTDLSKGREPGLPLGTLSGVDYLVFGKIHEMDVEAAKDLHLKAIGQTVKGGIPAKGSVRAHLYLQDVNNGEYILSEEIRFQPVLSQKGSDQSWADLLTAFADEASRRFLLGLRPLRIEMAGVDDVILNHGRAAGLTEGTELIAYSIGERRRDVYTGQLMEGIGSRAAARLEVTGFSPQGWAQAKIVRGNPQQGMPVQFVQEPANGSAGTVFEADSTKKTAAYSGVRRVAIATFGVTDSVHEVLGRSGNQLLTEFEDALVNRLVHDTGFQVADQKPSHLSKLIEQHQLTHGHDSTIPSGLFQGVDYLFYGRLLSATEKPGEQKHVAAVGETVHRPGEVRLKASLFLEDMQVGNYVLHETVELRETWQGGEQAQTAWSRLFGKLAQQGMAKALRTMRPLAVDWASKGMIGINHGRSAGLKPGDRLEAFTAGETRVDRFTGSTRTGIGARIVGRYEITGFNPDGWAEARLVDGEEPEAGARLKLVEALLQAPASTESAPKLNW